MKQYSKPTADVVELTVRENIAKLPYAHTTINGVRTSADIKGHSVTLTTYNLASSVDSNSVNG